jgi:hypothetical protein
VDWFRLAAAGRRATDQRHTIEGDDERDDTVRRLEGHDLIRNEPPGRKILDSRIPAGDDKYFARP